MMALFQANPQAFIKRNINNLKIGEILRVPERATVLAMTASEAHIAFRDQVENWRLDRIAPAMAQPAQPAEETVAGDSELKGKETTAAGLEEAAVPEAELKIARMQAAEEAGKSIADSADQKGGSANLKEDLLEAREMRESALEESNELKNRVENLASQLEDLQRLLELKDEQLAKLQIALGEKPDIPVLPVVEATTPTVTTIAPAAPEEAGDSPTETAAADEHLTPNLENAEDEKAAIDIPQFDGMTEQTEPAADAEDKAQATTAELAEQSAMTTEQAAAATVEKVEVKPSPVVEPAPVPKPEVGFLEKLTSHPLLKKITSDPTMMAIVGGVIAVLLALIWLLTGRRRKEDAEFQESILMDTIGDKEDAAVMGQADIRRA